MIWLSCAYVVPDSSTEQMTETWEEVRDETVTETEWLTTRRDGPRKRKGADCYVGVTDASCIPFSLALRGSHRFLFC